MSDTQKLVGHLVECETFRDAIHVAVVPVEAADILIRGERVKVNSEGFAVECEENESIGIVDPFLKCNQVKPGQKFFLFLFPGSITSLKHVWTHPSFPETERATGSITAQEKPSEKEISEQWLRNLADHLNVTYFDLIDSAKAFLAQKRRGEQWPDYLTGVTSMEGEVTPPQFWEHFQTVTGETAELEHRSNFFSCSC